METDNNHYDFAIERNDLPASDFIESEITLTNDQKIWQNIVKIKLEEE